MQKDDKEMEIMRAQGTKYFPFGNIYALSCHLPG